MELAREQSPSPACKRAFLTGTVTVLGGFSPLPPSTAPGWIVTVKSKHGRLWLLAVINDGITTPYRVIPIDCVPWEHWVGDPDKDLGIYNGDHPKQAAVAKQNEQNKT